MSNIQNILCSYFYRYLLEDKTPMFACDNSDELKIYSVRALKLVKEQLIREDVKASAASNLIR